MSRRQRTAPAEMPGPDALAGALDTFVELGPSRLEDGLVTEAADLRRRLDERLARGEGLTVVALAGGTGVGKSALTNALIGQQVAAEGVRRPTTSTPMAAVRSMTPEAEALLDWLEVGDRREVGYALPEGLVLLDLPDHDSVVEDHRRTSARLAGRVDVVLWVVDPIKYARDDAHAGSLAELTAHAEVLQVVLNRADELTEAEVETCLKDLRRRLAEGGHADADVLAASAVTGAGVGDLRFGLYRRAERQTAALARLWADAAVVARRAGERMDDAPDLEPSADEVLAEVLVAVDGHRAVAEAAGLYRHEAARQCRSPMARVAGAPFRALAGGWLRRATAAPGGPPPRAATTEAIETALHRSLDVGATVGRTHGSLDRAVRTAAGRAAPALTDAVAAAELVPGPRRWWTAMSLLRLVAETTAVVGAIWLAALAVIEWLRLPDIGVPNVAGELPWPTALLLGGILVRLVLAAATRLAARTGARRHARRVRRSIERGLRASIEQDLLEPVRRELADQQRLRAAVATLARP